MLGVVKNIILFQVTCGEHSLRSRDDYEVVLQVTEVIIHPR